MKSRLSYKFAVMLFILTGLGVSSHAQELFGVGTDFEIEARETAARFINPSNLYSIDPDTAQVTFIGEIGYDDCRGLDTHPITGELFAVCRDNFEERFVLLKVNTNTGSGDLVGEVDTDEMFFEFTDMSFRSDGVLFAHLRAKPSSLIIIIDTDTGEATTVGETGFFFSVGGLGFSLADELFYAGDDTFEFIFGLFDISQVNGTASLLTELSLSADGTILESLDTNPENGVLFLAYRERGAGGTLATINTANGFVSEIGPLDGTEIRAIAFRPPLVRNIPTMSQYGLVLSGVVLLAAALLVLRRRAKVS